MFELNQDRIALDRGSVRTIDQDGHLHVALNPISKANVCPYYGQEIPDADKLGLEPNRIYQLYRDPEELRKGASTFDGKPLQIIHRAQSAIDHDREVTVGAVKNPKWEAPYLKAELVVWDAEGIEAIDSGEQRQLSCGYRYVAIMEPGEIGGVKYDGRMTQIQGNHVALVTTGRAGSDVVVGDSAIQSSEVVVETLPVETVELHEMTATTLSRSARVASIALDAYLRPKLAKDQKVDLAKILVGTTGKEWVSNKPQIKVALDAAVKGKLVQDADITDVGEWLDRLDDVVGDEDPTPRAKDEDPDDDDEEEKKKKKAEAEDSDDDDDDDEEEKKKKAEAKDKKTAKDKQAKDKAVGITPAAMDAALQAMAKTTETRIHAQFKAIREAEQNVRPWVGEIAVPQPSAEAVYRLALDVMKVPDTATLHPDALWPILRAQPKPGDEERRQRPVMAVDSAADDDFAKRFPGALSLLRR
jgi:hypothetical protein